MDNFNNHDNMDRKTINGFKITRHYQNHLKPPPWFDQRVFYVRVSNFEVDDLTPEWLTLNHIPLGLDTILEVNGDKSSMFSECVSLQLRRDRVDKNSEEATFVSTDSVRMTGSVRFEVFDRNDLLLSGVLELCNSNGFTGESKNHVKKWNIKCQSHVAAARGLLKGKQCASPEMLPTIEVYVTGCFSGTPIILTKTLQLGYPKKSHAKATLDSIPEYESTELKKDVSTDSQQILEYRGHKSDHNLDDDDNSLYAITNYMEEEDGELSWFNAGVRVGVGIGLGICVGAGLGVGLLVRSYQATSRNFRRRLL